MATVVLRRRAPTPTSNLLERLLFNSARTFAPSSSAIRSFNANAQMTSESDSDERPSDLDRRRYRRGREEYPSIFSDVFDPFNPTRSLSQVLNLMDQVMDLPASARGVGAAPRRGWDAREDAEGLYLRIDMPGLGKEHVKVSAENGTLIIRGEGEKEGESEESRRRYSSRIDLPDNAYKLDGIKAEMKNGVLKVTVPKVKEEEKKDVYQVQIE